MLKEILRSKIAPFFLPVLLVIICGYVCFKNYSPGTYLTGWDTLHPEFNYGIYWKRTILGAWQSHQGLGSPASQAHASEIPRIIILQFLDIFLARNLVRYAFAFLTLILGPLGVYFFMKKVVLQEFGKTYSGIGAFLSGLFYLLNLGTLQHFNVPLEMFLVQYAFLGWIFLFVTKFFYDGDKRNLLWFSIITLIGSSQAHTPTLFYVYVMFLFIYLSILLLLHLFSKNKQAEKSGLMYLKRGSIIFLFTLLINSFWLLPNFYYGVVKGNEVPLSKIHHLFSEEAFLVNKKYGNIKDTAILKNFLFDWGVYKGDDTYGSLLRPWIIHQKNPFVLVLGYLLSLVVFSGFVMSLLKRKKVLFPWIIIGFLSIFFIFNVNPPFGRIFVFFQNTVPLFKELFRFPFTKFSIFLMFVYSVFFGYAISVISDFVGRKTFKVSAVFIWLAFSSALIYFSLPAFKGQLINPAMRVEIPDRYFQMFKFFDEEKEYGRVLHLPIHSFWGWETYSWDDRGLGYQGAGFLWFGIKQPLIDREFDRWNIANEQPYRELSTAIYSKNEELLQKYLEKYKIRWVVLDKSILAPGLDKKILFHKEIEQMFSDLGSVSIAKDFGDGLLVYEYSPNTDFKRVENIFSYRVSGNTLFKEYYDPVYVKYGNYVSGDEATHQFLGFNSLDENIDSSLIYSDEKDVHLKLPYGDGKYPGIGKIPATLKIKSNGGGSSIEVLYNDILLGTIPINLSDGVYFMKLGESFYSLSGLGLDGFVGNYLASPSEAINYKVYKLGDKVKVDEILYSNLESCDPLGSDNYSSYSLSKISSGFKITGKNTLACVTSSASKFLGSETSGPVAVSFSSDMEVMDRDFCMLNNFTGLCVDHFVRGSYFISDITPNILRYDLRFFSDARNSKEEVSKSYFDVSIYPMVEILNGNLKYDVISSVNIKGYLSFPKVDYLTIEPREIEGNRRACQIGQNLEESNFIDSGKGLVFNSTKSSLCDSYDFPLASHKDGYIMEVRSEYFEGVPLRICLTNETSKRCDIEVSLPANKSEGTYYFMIPPMGEGVGYTINVSNYVFGDTMSRNELRYLSLIPVSYELVKNIEVSIPQKGGGNLYVLNEAYDPGWLALCGIWKCGASHVKVNNWANGWVFENGIPDNVKVYFWPQILEFIGFGLLGVSLVISFRYREITLLKSALDPNPEE